MPLVIDDSLALLLIAAAKTAVSEALFWAKERSKEEIDQRTADEEARTEDLMSRLRGG